MKAFDLARAKAGEPLVTGNGRPVVIMSFEVRNKRYPLLGYIVGKTSDIPMKWSNQGKSSNNSMEQQLFMEEQACEGYVNLYRNGVAMPRSSTKVFASYKEAAQEVSPQVGETYIATTKIVWEE